MRSTAPCSMRPSCTDGTSYRTDGTRRAGINSSAGPRTGPRPPQRTPDVNYGTLPCATRDPPFGVGDAARGVAVMVVQIWPVYAAGSARACCLPFGSSGSGANAGQWMRPQCEADAVEPLALFEVGHLEQFGVELGQPGKIPGRADPGSWPSTQSTKAGRASSSRAGTIQNRGAPRHGRPEPGR
jgi:hypothetical protein